MNALLLVCLTATFALLGVGEGQSSWFFVGIGGSVGIMATLLVLNFTDRPKINRLLMGETLDEKHRRLIVNVVADALEIGRKSNTMQSLKLDKPAERYEMAALLVSDQFSSAHHSTTRKPLLRIFGESK